MTPNWAENWGGHLAFYDEAGNVVEAFKTRAASLGNGSPSTMQCREHIRRRTANDYLGWLLA